MFYKKIPSILTNRGDTSYDKIFNVQSLLR